MHLNDRHAILGGKEHLGLQVTKKPMGLSRLIGGVGVEGREPILLVYWYEFCCVQCVLVSGQEGSL